MGEISNFDLLGDLAEVVDFIELKTHLHKILNQKESEIQFPRMFDVDDNSEVRLALGACALENFTEPYSPVCGSISESDFKSPAMTHR